MRRRRQTLPYLLTNLLRIILCLLVHQSTENRVWFVATSRGPCGQCAACDDATDLLTTLITRYYVAIRYTVRRMRVSQRSNLEGIVAK